MRMHSFRASTRFSWRAADLQGRPAKPNYLWGLVSSLRVPHLLAAQRPAGWCPVHRSDMGLQQGLSL